MTTVTTRTVKGEPLTWAELDANFNDLNTNKYETGGALGTPSGATLTNATGLPISTGVSGLGTGVATALAVNVGSAGAPVVLNGAGGTPLSATLTNATGLPISTGVSGLGTGVATALAINVGSAGAPVVFNGALGTPSSGTLTNCTGYPVPVGSTVQVVEATPLTTKTNCATAIPYDDSIPQITEGDQILTKAITPTSATNRLRIEIDVPLLGASANVMLTLALFQDSTANALAAGSTYAASIAGVQMTLVHEMAAGTTSATTFTVRLGPDSGTAYVNGEGSGGNRRLGGVAAARLRVTEIKV